MHHLHLSIPIITKRSETRISPLTLQLASHFRCGLCLHLFLSSADPSRGDLHSQRLAQPCQRLSFRTALNINVEIHVQHDLDLTLNLFFPSQLKPIHSPRISTPIFTPTHPSSILVHLLHRIIMSGSSESRYIRLNGEYIISVSIFQFSCSIYSHQRKKS
jgi:hypothetical protein